MAKKLGNPGSLPEILRGDFLTIIEEANDIRSRLRFKALEGDQRADIEIYGAEDLPSEIDGDKVTVGYAMPEGKRELIVIERRVAEREESYRRALCAHEAGHAFFKLKHSSDRRARSIMISGLRRDGENHYTPGFREDDLERIEELYAR
jgi:hypothetical protein